MDGDGTKETPARATVNLLLNPDGYTSFYDGVVEQYIGKIFDGNINPYKNLWFNPVTTSPDSNYDPIASPQYGFTNLEAPTGHNVFPMGGKFDNPLSETLYEISFESTDKINFMFILEASYGHTTRMMTRKEPRFFLPEFHRKDAYKVNATLIADDLIGRQATSTATLRIEAFDWQAGITPTPGWDYKTSNLTAIKYASDIKEVVIDINEILNGPIFTTLAQTVSGNGSFTDPYTWEIAFTNQKAADSGTYWGLVAVRDALEGTPNAPLATSGSAMTPKRLCDVTTYQLFDVFVEEGNDPPIADVLVNPDPVKACKDVTISVGPICRDPDGTIVTYEYDIDYSGNPTTFAADYTQNSGNPDFGQPIVIQFNETQTGNHIIGQRVTDDKGAQAIDAENVQVNPNLAPNAVLQDSDTDNVVDHNESVTFQPGIGTGDPDGVITKYEYDWAYNGSTFTADVIQNQGDLDFGQPVNYAFQNTGSSDIQVTVALRVTDDGCPDLTAMASTVFTVHPQITYILYEDFESTSNGAVPTGWGVTGRTGGAYYLNTSGYGCINTAWKWGVTENSGQCDGGELKFLNESGYDSGQYTSDSDECYQNRGHIAYTPEFTVPASGATLTISHNYNFLRSDLDFPPPFPPPPHYLDGGQPILSDDDPGSISWTDFCNNIVWDPFDPEPLVDNTPKRPLVQLTGPTLHTISANTDEAHPLFFESCNSGSSGGWTTSTYDISGTLYGGENVRLGFLFASDDLLSYNPWDWFLLPDWAQDDCTQWLDSAWGGDNLFPGFGWRINWVKIEGN